MDRRNLINDIERWTGQPVTIEAVETERALSRCNLQEDCPLFALLPREIRDFIWAYATAPYEDEAHGYDENEYYYRPSHTAPLKTETNVLLTCRRVWLEANAFPMLQAEHCFWYFRPAPDCRSPQWMASLTDLNRKNFGQLHLFAQMFAIEVLNSQAGKLRDFFLKTPAQLNDFQPRVLHVTIRHTDWWNWEHGAALHLKESWVQALLDSVDLRSTQILKLELETLETNVKQLLPIIERLEKLQSKVYETHVLDGEVVTTKFVLRNERRIHKWSGPANINGQTFGPYRGMDRLDYHVVTLTWALTFPQVPRGHVPTLRRAPRVLATGPAKPSPLISKDKPTQMRLSSGPELPPVSGGGRNSRRRVYKKLKACLWPAKKDELVEMRNAEFHVGLESVHRAQRHEDARREIFEEAMKPFHARVRAKVQARKWETEGSLLRFV